jgi:hypothetical protein
VSSHCDLGRSVAGCGRSSGRIRHPVPSFARGLAVRVWPVLLFVVAITVVTELSAEAALTPIRFAALMIAPGAVAILVPSVLVFLHYRRSLIGRYELPPSNRPDDGVLLWTWAIVVVAILPFGLLPWQLVLFACGLFLVVGSTTCRPIWGSSPRRTLRCASPPYSTASMPVR